MDEQREPMLQWFAYEHLPEPLRSVSSEFRIIAEEIVRVVPRNPERTVALRKLLEAKDCAVRALIYKEGRDGRKRDEGDCDFCEGWGSLGARSERANLCEVGGRGQWGGDGLFG